MLRVGCAALSYFSTNYSQLNNVMSIIGPKRLQEVFVIGGGLAGLVTAIQLVKQNIPCVVIEKNFYPQHKVCGEYISNEVVPFLQSAQLFDPHAYPQISQFQLSSTIGQSALLNLDLGGFGVSRHTLDHMLYKEACKHGVKFLLNTTVTNVLFNGHSFHIYTDKGEHEAAIVVGAYGKRSTLDKLLNRSFMTKKSPYMAVKYHIRTTHPDNLIALHNFDGGYCGISNVENGITNVCYLVRRDKVRAHKTIENFEDSVLRKNPLLDSIFNHCDHVFSKPLVINEISFATKGPVENHILMVGDSAGMITPLCGNGMAMAIHSAKIVSESIVAFHTSGSKNRLALEQQYARQWKKHFKQRLWKGRQIQQLFGSKVASSLAVQIAIHSRPFARFLVRQSHGSPF